jgi:hypothetical protein
MLNLRAAERLAIRERADNGNTDGFLRLVALATANDALEQGFRVRTFSSHEERLEFLRAARKRRDVGRSISRWAGVETFYLAY